GRLTRTPITDGELATLMDVENTHVAANAPAASVEPESDGHVLPQQTEALPRAAADASADTRTDAATDAANESTAESADESSDSVTDDAARVVSTRKDIAAGTPARPG